MADDLVPPVTLSEALEELSTAKANAATHTLFRPGDCGQTHGDYPCIVCDGGLGICRTCGAGEVELSDYSCEAFLAKRGRA